MSAPNLEPRHDFTYDPAHPKTRVVELGGEQVEVRDTNNLHQLVESYVRVIGKDEGTGAGFGDLIVNDPTTRRLLDAWSERQPEQLAAAIEVSRQKRQAKQARGGGSVATVGNLAVLSSPASQEAERAILFSNVMGDLEQTAAELEPGFNVYELGR